MYLHTKKKHIALMAKTKQKNRWLALDEFSSLDDASKIDFVLVCTVQHRIHTHSNRADFHVAAS